MSKNKGILLILSTAVISGLAVFVSKFGVSVVNPYIFTGWKNIIVAVLAIAWIIAFRDWRALKTLAQKKWLMLILVGLIGGSIPFLLFFKGLSLTTAAQGSFIHKTMFIYVAILAAIFLKEKISRGFLAAGLLMILGNILLLGLIPHRFGWGDGLILMATLLWAGESVLSKYLLTDLPARIVVWARMFFGSVFIVLFWLLTDQFALALALDLAQIGWILATSVLLFGYAATWYSGLKYVKVSEAAAILLLGSSITTLLSLFFLGEHLLVGQAIGIILTLAAAVFIFKLSSRYAQEKPVRAV
jgi:drug/metabolite transporter (DMT)-like permease